MISQSPTFCPAPWTSLNIDQAGRVSPCFHCVDVVGNVKVNTIQEVITGPVLTDMRQSMSRGEWAPGCAWCKRLEETTGASGRTVRKASAETIAAIDADPDFFKLEHLVVNWSNLCNLACVYCNPETSTAWQSIKKIPINHIKNEHADLIELARTQGHNIQGLSLGGGEPLLQKGLEQFLDYIDASKISVMVTTNLSVDLEHNAIYQRLKTWPNVSWMISFDNANQDKFEYVRHGADWQLLQDNLQSIKYLMQNNGHWGGIHAVYNIYSATRLCEFRQFAHDTGLSVLWQNLFQPKCLDPFLHGPEVAARSIDQIEKLYAMNIVAPSEQQFFDRALEKYHSITTADSDIKKDFEKHIVQNETQHHPDQAGKFEQLWPELAHLCK